MLTTEKKRTFKMFIAWLVVLSLMLPAWQPRRLEVEFLHGDLRPRTAFSVSAHSSIIQQFSQIHKVCLKQAYLYYRFFLPGVLQNRFPAAGRRPR